MIANWPVRYADGQLTNQSTDAHMNASIDAILDWKRNERPAAMVYGGLCSAPFHFQHFDEILADIGAKTTKRSDRLAEQFPYPNAFAYAQFLASATQYRVQ